MSEYGQYKKRNAAKNQLSSPDTGAVADPLPPLTPDEEAHCREMQKRWNKYFPDDPFLKKMVALGFIRGYRDVKSITPINPSNDQE